MDVKTIRRVRLTWLRDTRFGGVAAKLARAIDKSEAQVNRWLSGHRKISEDSAAHIESRLRQDPGSMGREPPATDIKHAIGLLIASWKAADPARHTDLYLHSMCVPYLDEYSTPRQVHLRLQNGPYDSALLICIEEATGLDIEFERSPPQVADARDAAPHQSAGVAQEVSYQAITLPQKIDWESVMSSAELPGSQRRTSTEPAASGLFLARVKII